MFTTGYLQLSPTQWHRSCLKTHHETHLLSIDPSPHDQSLSPILELDADDQFVHSWLLCGASLPRDGLPVRTTFRKYHDFPGMEQSCSFASVSNPAGRLLIEPREEVDAPSKVRDWMPYHDSSAHRSRMSFADFI